MDVTEEQQRKAIQFLRKAWRDLDCSRCGKREWTIHPHVFEFRTFNEGSIVVGGPVVPVLVVECDNCGYTVTVNAMKAGVVEPREMQGGS